MGKGCSFAGGTGKFGGGSLEPRQKPSGLVCSLNEVSAHAQYVQSSSDESRHVLNICLNRKTTIR